MATPGTRILDRGEGPSLVLAECRLVVVGGPDTGREAGFAGTAMRIGTDPDNDLVLTDPSVSAHHFEVSATESGYLLRDLGSTNGTTVAGLRADRVYLTDGVELRVGESRLRFVVGDGEVSIPISRRTNFGALLGHSPAMRAAFAVLERAASTDVTVMIQGESGTGKELAARGLHEASKRHDGPYAVFDCGATTPTLLESQLFGHVKGAFTGAVEARGGVFEEADGGTLVLDEIGELPIDLQPKLLRALETRTVQRIGESRQRKVDVRFVASTNRNLEEEVRAGRFREDLFFRLSVITVRLPPLRERCEEIPRLVHHFLTQLGADMEVPEDTLALLRSHRWPGNVRELRNFVERFVTLPDLEPEVWLPGASARGSAQPAGDAAEAKRPPPTDLAMPFHEAKQRYTDFFEREYLSRLLEAHGHNLSEAARVSGLSRQSCYRLIKKHGLRADE